MSNNFFLIFFQKFFFSAFSSTLKQITFIHSAGILGQPAALAQAGWMGLVLLAIICIVSNYTGRILVKSMYAKKPIHKMHSYHSLGREAFGGTGGGITMVFQNLTLFFVGCLFLILAGINIKQLIEEWTSNSIELKWIISLVALSVWPLVVGLKTMHEISIVAFFGMLATGLVVVVIVIVSDMNSQASAVHQIINWQVKPSR